MIHKKILLRELYPQLGKSDAILETYVYEPNPEIGMDYKRPGLLVIPGGGYEFVSWREKEPVCFAFGGEGFNTFAITYSINKKYPIPQQEVACAMDYIRRNSEQFCTFRDMIGVCGFSAGGHLAASFSAYYPEIAEGLGLKAADIQPQFAMLSYPVITMVAPTHEGTKRVITGGDKGLIDKMSIELHVTKDYPPTYIWTTMHDTCVPPISSILMEEALRKAGVTYKFRLFPDQDHGLSVGTNASGAPWLPDGPHPEWDEIRTWVHEAAQFVTTKVRKLK